MFNSRPPQENIILYECLFLSCLNISREMKQRENVTPRPENLWGHYQNTHLGMHNDSKVNCKFGADENSHLIQYHTVGKP